MARWHLGLGSLVVCALMMSAFGRSVLKHPPEELTRSFCGTARTVTELVNCIVQAMPKVDSEGYVRPEPNELTAWRGVVRRMLDGACEGVLLPVELSGIYEVRKFRDQEANREYCLLLEVGDADQDGVVDRGWGTFLFNPDATREFVQAVPHPINDQGTHSQAAYFAVHTSSRAFLMAGSHRYASREPSDCQEDERLTDVSHDVNNMYFATVLELQDFYREKPWTLLAWHEMPVRECPRVNVYIAQGVSERPPSDSTLFWLRDELREMHPKWTVSVPGDSPSCHYNGTTAVEGRLLNGVPVDQVCTTPATQASGRFIHIEQHARYTDPEDWIQAVNALSPEAPGLPPKR